MLNMRRIGLFISSKLSALKHMLKSKGCAVVPHRVGVIKVQERANAGLDEVLAEAVDVVQAEAVAVEAETVDAVQGVKAVKAVKAVEADQTVEAVEADTRR